MSYSVVEAVSEVVGIPYQRSVFNHSIYTALCPPVSRITRQSDHIVHRSCISFLDRRRLRSFHRRAQSLQPASHSQSVCRRHLLASQRHWVARRRQRLIDDTIWQCACSLNNAAARSVSPTLFRQHVACVIYILQHVWPDIGLPNFVVIKWDELNEWVAFDVPGHFVNESFQKIACTGTDHRLTTTTGINE